jgi:hypothetical protein
MSHDSLGNDRDYCVYEVFDLGSFDVIARFMTEADATDYALRKSINGPALQIRKKVSSELYQIIHVPKAPFGKNV